jgi:hypothetical protein
MAPSRQAVWDQGYAHLHAFPFHQQFEQLPQNKARLSYSVEILLLPLFARTVHLNAPTVQNNGGMLD